MFLCMLWQQVSKALDPKIKDFCQVTVKSMAYARTGDILTAQRLTEMAGKQFEVAEGEQWKVQPFLQPASVTARTR